MTRKPRCFQPRATELESRLLLSVTTSPASQAAEVAVVSERSGSIPSVAIVNSVSGKYFAAEDNRAADAPLHVQLHGLGRVNGLGRVKLAGSLDLGGFRVAGSQDVSGTLILSNARGTVKIRLTGSGGFSDVPGGHFSTTVTFVKGTGAFRGFQRDGTVDLDFGLNQARSIKAPSPIGGSTTVTFHLKPLVK